MKHPGRLFLGVVCLATSLFAQDANSTQKKQVTGTICNSACVVQQNNLATCDRNCTDKTGATVLVDDQGKVMKISNPQMAASHMYKRVKCTAVPSEKEREESLEITELQDLTQ
jgi:hypothetical protein